MYIIWPFWGAALCGVAPSESGAREAELTGNVRLPATHSGPSAMLFCRLALLMAGLGVVQGASLGLASAEGACATAPHTMKFVVLGATGATGQQLVSQALKSGHEVTAVARHPQALGHLVHANLHVVHEAELNEESISKHVAGHDAVLVALGPRSTRKKSTVVCDSVDAALKAMTHHGVRRIVVVSAGPVDRKATLQPFVLRRVLVPVLWHFLHYVYEDLSCTEGILRMQDPDAVKWTIVRPALLTQGALTKMYRWGPADQFAFSMFDSLSRADLAHFMLEAAVNSSCVGMTVAIAH